MAEPQVTDDEIRAQIKANLAGQGKQAPTAIDQWIVVRHPTTGEPIYLIDPKDATNKIPIPAAPVQGPAQPPTPPSQMIRLDAQYNVITDPSVPAVFIKDPQTPGATPFKLETGKELSDPSKWTTREIAGATVIYDPDSKAVVATVPASADQTRKRTGTYTDMIDPNDPNQKRVIAKVDTGSKEIFSVTADPNLPGRQIIQTPKALYVFGTDPTKPPEVVGLDPASPMQAVIVDGKILNFDTTTGKTTVSYGGEEHPPITNPADGSRKVWVGNPDGTGKYEYEKGAEPAAGLAGVGTQSKYLYWYTADGKIFGQTENPNYQAPTAVAASPNSVAPMIQVPESTIKAGGDPGKLVWVKNEGQLTISQATQNLVTALTGTTADPNHPMTLDEAKTIIDASVSRMNADTQRAATAGTAAGNVLSNIQSGATTGAGILQNRVTNTTNLIQQGLNIATGSGGRYGNYSGGLLNPIPGIGQALVGGAQAFATELGGGQAVYDTAVRMVQAADPNNQNPDRAAAVATLTQLMDGYKKNTGQDYPTVAATKALLESQKQGGLAAPGDPAASQPTVSPAAVTPTVFQAQFDPRLNPAFPQQPGGTVLPPGIAGTVPMDDPRFGRVVQSTVQPRSAEELGWTAPPLGALA